MRNISYFFQFIFGLLITFSCASTVKNKVESTDLVYISINSEEGYLLKNEAIDLLEKIEMSKKSDKGWNFIKESDTIGRFFKSNETENLLFCIMDSQDTFDFETYVLIELKKTNKNNFKLIAKERYFQGNYSCCWNNYYGGFNKFQNYFTFDCCGTGSSFCGTHTYYFKNVVPQDSLISIHENYTSGFEDALITLSSTKTMKQNTIKYFYKFEHYKLEGE